MTRIRARFDGRVLVPEEPVDLPVNCAVDLLVQQATEVKEGAARGPLKELALSLAKLPANSAWPQDGAAQHDHYLYGVPKLP